MLIKALQLIHGRQLATFSGRHFFFLDLARLPLGRQPRHADLVAEHLHSGAQIQGTELRIRGDMHMEVTALQLVIGQAGVFTTEHQCDFSTLGRLCNHFLPALARVQQRPGDPAVTSTGAEHQIAAHQGILKGGDNLCVFQNITGTRGARIGFMVREHPWLHQNQPRQPHVLHGTRSTADVPGMAGIDQNDTNIRQQWKRSQTSKREQILPKQNVISYES